MAEAAATRLRFVIEWNGTFQEFNVRVGEAVSIGRAHGSGILIEDSCVSSQHVQLHAARQSDGGKLCLWGRDMSRNGTGILEDAGSGAGEPDVQKLRSDRAEELVHGVELIVPLTRSQSKEEKPRARLVVHLLGADKPLPAPSSRPYTESAIAAACTRVARLARQPPTASVLAAAGMSVNNGFPADDPHSVAAFALAAETPCLPPGGVRLMPRPVPRGLTNQAADGQSQNGGLDAAGLPDSYNPVTGTGRWRYENRLGEGGLGVVYRATDRKGSLGEVAVKVLKRNSRFPKRDARHAFAMHRESQWSIRWMHNESDARYREEPAALFARYLEDHTGFSELEPKSFDEKRRRYEAPDFDWDVDGPSLPPHPYVVMEYVKGEALQLAIDRERKPIVEGSQEPPALSTDEKRAVVVQATLALEYLVLFSLIHRDFRGCNMHLVSRSGENSPCTLKVLDLGVMICGEDGQQTNSNSAVQAFKRRGATEEKRRRYDWLPWEVRDGADGNGPAVNFSWPPHTFDVFSLGVLILHLLVGKTEARATLDTIHTDARIANPAPLGIDLRLLQRMLSREATERPPPGEVLDALERRGFLTKRTPLLPREDEEAVALAEPNRTPCGQSAAVSATPSVLAEPPCTVLVEPSAIVEPPAVAEIVKDAEMSSRPVDIKIPRGRGRQVTVLSSSPTRLSNVGSRSRSRSAREKKQTTGPPVTSSCVRSRSRSRTQSRERKQRERRDKWAKVTEKVDVEAKVQADAQEQARAIAKAHAEACAKAKAEECRRAEAQFYEAQQQAKREAEAKALKEAEAVAERARVEAEASAGVAAEAAERARRDAEARERAERENVEAEARTKAKAKAKKEAEAVIERARLEAEAQEKADRVRAEARAKAVAEAKAIQERVEAEIKAKTEREAAAIVDRLRSDAEAKAKADSARPHSQTRELRHHASDECGTKVEREANTKTQIQADERARVVEMLVGDAEAEVEASCKEDDKVPLSDICACGAHFAEGNLFCRKCGAKREVQRRDSKAEDTSTVPSRGGGPPPPTPTRSARFSQPPLTSGDIHPPPPPPPTRSARWSQPPPPPGTPKLEASSDQQSLISSAVPKFAATSNQQSLIASAVPKSKDAAFPPANACFPSGFNFGASPAPVHPSMMQGFQMPSAMMGMSAVGLPGQQLPIHLHQAWASQQMAMGFSNFGAAAASWNQAFQPAVPLSHEAILGTTKCIRPPRANANGHSPY